MWSTVKFINIIIISHNIIMTDYDDINEFNSAPHLDDKNNIHHIPITDV